MILNHLSKSEMQKMVLSLIGSVKGGVGKSLIATSLATAHALQGDKVLLVDADRQATSYNWAVRREQNEIEPAIPYTTVTGADFGDYLLDFKGQFEHLIIDCAGHDSQEFRTALLLADLLISPLQPAQFDMETLTSLNSTIEQAQTIRADNDDPPLIASFVINRASTHPANTETQEAIEVLEQFPDLHFTGGVICDRIDYRRAAIEGKSVLEQTPANSKAIAEINFLFTQVQNEQAKNPSANRASA